MKNQVQHINLKFLIVALLAFLALGSSVVTAQPTQWVGSVSTAWDNPDNWDKGVPNSTISAIIKSATFAPIVPATGAHVLDIDTQAGGTLNFGSGSILTVHGTNGLKNTGTINLDDGQIIFKQNVVLFNGGVFNAETGTVQMNGGTWENKSGSTFSPGTSTVIFDGAAGTIIGDMTFYNVIFTSAGTITAQGNINVLNDATIDAGTTLDIMGTFTLDVQGTFTNNGTVTASKPYITAASTPSLTQVDVTFSENLDQTSAETDSNYAIDQGITVSSAQRDATNNAVVHLTVSTLTIGTEDTLTVNQVKDLAGNSVSTDHKKRFTVTVTAGEATKVRVETAPDGSGTVVPAQSVASGSSITVYAITRDASDNFVANVSGAWSMTSTTGGVAGTDLSTATGTSTIFTGHVAGTGKIHVTSGGLTAGDSGTITVTSGTATKVRVETAPDGSGTVVPLQSVASGSSITVYAITRDASDNFVANVAATAWSLQSITGGVVSGDLVAGGDKKSAVFTGHVAGTAAIQATSPPLATTNSGTITVNAGAVSKLVVTLPGQTFTPGTGNSGTPTAQTAGTAFNITSITATDANFNTVTSYSGSKTISYTGPGGTPTYTTAVSFTNGQSTTTLTTTLTKAETTTITASDGTTTGPASSSLTVNAGAFTNLQLLVPGETAAPGTASGKTGTPTAQTAGTAFTVTVNAVDANWNLVNTVTDNVGITSSDENAALPSNAALVAGTKTFSVTLKTVGTATVTASDITDVSKTANTSPWITVNPGALHHFAISAISSPQTACTAFAITTITAQDANNNTVTSFTGTVTFGGTAGVTGTSAAFSSGVLNNASVTPTVAGSSLTVTVNDGSAHTGSATIATVNPGALHYFAISAISSPQTACTAFAITTITAQDANNNTVTSFTGTVDLTETGGGAGGTVTPSQSSAFTAGVLSGQSVTLSKSGSGVTITATDHAGTGKTGTSGNFNITAGAAAKLAFTIQPGGGTGGTAWTTQPVVTVQDAGGNTVTDDNSTLVTVAIGTNPSSGTLSGTKTVTVSSGVATFSGLSIDKAGTGYTLTATSSPSYTSATSSAFNVTAGAVSKLVVTLPGQTFTSGTGNSGSVTAQAAGTAFNITSITATDANFNTVTSYSGSKTMSYTGPGGTPTYTTGVSFTNGQSTTILVTTLTKAETTTITASDGTTTGPASSSLTVNVANKLAFTTSPGGATVGTAFTTQPVVTIQDAGGNTVTSSSAAVAVAITSGTGTTGATLSGTTTVNASSGVATFSGLRIDKAGTGYTLTASSSGLTGATSSAFNVYPTNVTVPSATGRGNITLVTNSPGCGFSNVQVFTEDQTVVDPGYDYLYGLVGFTVNCSAADVSITFTGATDLTGLPYQKYGPTTPGDLSTTKWYTFNNVTVTGNTYILHLQDGVLGDDTAGGDNMIVDVGGPGQPQQQGAVPIPTLTEWGMIIFMVLAALGSIRYLRRLKRV